jgi:hypothetical protein
VILPDKMERQEMRRQRIDRMEGRVVARTWGEGCEGSLLHA